MDKDKERNEVLGLHSQDSTDEKNAKREQPCNKFRCKVKRYLNHIVNSKY